MATLKSSRHAPRDEARPGNSPGRFVAVEEIAWTMARYDWPRFHGKMTQSGYISTERDGYFVVTKPDRGSWPIDGRRIEVAPSIEGIRSIRTDRTGERNVGLHLDGARWLLDERQVDPAYRCSGITPPGLEPRAGASPGKVFLGSADATRSDRLGRRTLHRSSRRARNRRSEGSQIDRILIA